MVPGEGEGGCVVPAAHNSDSEGGTTVKRQRTMVGDGSLGSRWRWVGEKPESEKERLKTETLAVFGGVRKRDAGSVE